MHRQILISILPEVVLIVCSVAVVALLIRLSGARLRVAHLLNLHRDEKGAVQSLSFVLTLPVFIIVMMFIVQLSQITIAKIVVEYAAYTAVRTAAVWIPANLNGSGEMENEFETWYWQGDEVGSDGLTYNVLKSTEGGAKFNKIHFAAAMACMPICPSRDLAIGRDHSGNSGLTAIQTAYFALAPGSESNTRVPDRLANKLAYALENTRIEVEIRHKNDSIEPWLAHHDVPPYIDEFTPDEIGWQDQITVKVTHDFALLPGPARILARRADAPIGSSPEANYGTDRISRELEQRESVWIRSISAVARMNNEGEKSRVPYVQELYGVPGYAPPLDDDTTEEYEEQDDALTNPDTGEGIIVDQGCCGEASDDFEISGNRQLNLEGSLP